MKNAVLLFIFALFVFFVNSGGNPVTSTEIDDVRFGTITEIHSEVVTADGKTRSFIKVRDDQNENNFFRALYHADAVHAYTDGLRSAEAKDLTYIAPRIKVKAVWEKNGWYRIVKVIDE